MAGSVTTFVFDKTGTLTEEGLSVQGFRCSFDSTSSSDRRFMPFTNNSNDFTPTKSWWED